MLPMNHGNIVSISMVSDEIDGIEIQLFAPIQVIAEVIQKHKKAGRKIYIAENFHRVLENVKIIANFKGDFTSCNEYVLPQTCPTTDLRRILSASDIKL